MKMKKIYCVICGNYRKFKNPAFLKKQFFLLFSVTENEVEKIFKEEESIQILKIVGLIKNIYLLSIYG